MSGSNHRPTPLDFYLLESMPEKGMIGGIHWRGRRARDLRTEIAEKLDVDVKVSTVQARLRAMTVAGFVENFAATGGIIWARTPEGTAYLSTKNEVLGITPRTGETR